jgi:hypothetical protein
LWNRARGPERDRRAVGCLETMTLSKCDQETHARCNLDISSGHQTLLLVGAKFCLARENTYGGIVTEDNDDWTPPGAERILATLSLQDLLVFCRRPPATGLPPGTARYRIIW